VPVHRQTKPTARDLGQGVLRPEKRSMARFSLAELPPALAEHVPAQARLTYPRQGALHLRVALDEPTRDWFVRLYDYF